MSQQKAKWKKLGTRSSSKSERQRSEDKYHPKRQSQMFSEERDVFDLPHFTASKMNKTSFMLNGKSQIQQKKILSQIGRQETPNSISDRIISEIQNANASTKPHHRQIKKQSRVSMIVNDTCKGLTTRNNQRKSSSLSQFNVFESAELFIDTRASVQENFKICLKFIEKIEKDFRDERIQIERELLNRGEELKSMKCMILDSYTDKGVQFKDPELRRALEKFNSQKKKILPKQLVRIKSADVLNPKMNGTMRIKKKQLSKLDDEFQLKSIVSGKGDSVSKKSVMSGRSGRSKASELCKDKFGRIMSSLQQMRKGLNQYRQTKTNYPKMNFRNLLAPSSSQQI